jgi:hypothetical protein
MKSSLTRIGRKSAAHQDSTIDEKEIHTRERDHYHHRETNTDTDIVLQARIISEDAKPSCETQITSK